MPFRSHSRTGQHRDSKRDVTVASATLISRNQVKSVAKKQDWQTECWSMYDSIGELRFATQWRGNALSRAHLFIGAPDNEGDDEPTPMDNPGVAGDLLADLHYGKVGQGEMLRRMSMHLSIPGETYLIGMEPDPELDGPDAEHRWLVASTDEFFYKQGGSKPKVTMPETGQARELDPETSTIIRIWNPHPKTAWLADSSVRANLTPLREVHALSQHISATVDSRLAGAGVLFVPHSASMPSPSQADANGQTTLHDNPFIDGLTQAMITPLQDREDASAVVPIVATVNEEAIGKIQHVSFATPLDEKATTMRRDALARFARGSDLPPEIIEGQGDTNHWTSWNIDESALKMHIEPLLAVICDALTQQYLWPALKAHGVDDPESYVIWFDTSELSQRPDRSAEAQSLWDKGELSSETLRRENGFGDEDAPTDDERQVWRAWRLVESQPALMPYLGSVLGFDQIDLPAQPAGRHLQPVESAPAEPEGNRPELPSAPIGEGEAPASTAASAAPQPEAAAWMLTAVEQAVMRALELAGKRMVNNQSRAIRGRVKDTPAWQVHAAVGPVDREHAERLLNGAFAGMEATMPAESCVRATAEDYCLGLLTSAVRHSREDMAAALSDSGCLAA